MHNNVLYQELKIIQHNVLTWTKERSVELANLYNRNNPDIILLNAVSVRQNKPVKIFNYNTYSKNQWNEMHAGVTIAVRKNLQHKIIDDFNEDILGIQIETTKGPIAIYTTYSPPRRNYLPIGDIKRIAQKRIPTYLIGDINANHPTFGYNYSNNKGVIMKNLIDTNYVNYLGPDFPTMVGRGGRPDAVFANRWAALNIVIQPGMLTSSDHIPLYIKVSTKPIMKETRTQYDYKNANWDSYKAIIEENTNNTDLNGITKQRIDEEIKNWMNNILTAANQTIPKNKPKYYIHAQESDYLKLLEEVYIRLRNYPYWNRETRTMIHNIQEQLRTENQRIYNEKWSTTIAQSQEAYRDPQKFWVGIRRLMGGNNNIIPYLVDTQGNKIFTERDKEGVFQDIWKNIFKIDPRDNQTFDLNHERMVQNYLHVHDFELELYARTDLDRLDPDNYLTRPVTLNDLKQIIKDMKNKAPGESGIKKIMLINLPEVALIKYKDIINATLSIGYFPIILKNGIIILIPKPGKDGKNPINYRPITLLELPGKILERVLNNRLQRYCEDNNVFHSCQFGFRKGRGTDVAITTLYEIIALNQKWKDHANVVCRDISKAFDKIWIDGLKYKIIQQDNLPQIMKKILASYVTDRTAQIRINTYIGNKFQLESGVPQGGILSPTMFILYTSDIPRAGANSMDILFADDVTQVIENKNNDRQQLAIDTEREIKRINDYESKWKIMTNTTKFKVLSVSKSRPTQVNVNNRVIPFANAVGVLGLNLRRTGFVSHITGRINLAKTQTNKITRFKELKDTTKLHLYKALIRPILEYPVVPNAMASETQLRKMQRIQNKNLRMVVKNTENEGKTMEQIHEVLNIEPINIRLYMAARKLWEKFQTKQPNIYNMSMTENQNEIRDHSWWPRVACKLETGIPEPMYV